MSGKISEMTETTSIDRNADYFEAYKPGVGTRRTNVSSMLGGMTGTPVGTSDTQTLTNKTLTSPTINTPTLTVNDNSLTIRDNSDTTKQAQFQLSGITTGTTRTYTLPDVTDTLVSLTASQTLTNKTLTSPTVNNPTLNVDTISEFTSANGVTIDGLNIKDSAITTNNSVPNNALSNSGSFGSGWAWSTWTPTLTGITQGNGTVEAYWTQIGKTVHFHFVFTMGSTSTMSSGNFSPPVNANARYDNLDYAGHARYNDITAAAANFAGVVRFETASELRPINILTNTTYTQESGLSATTPFTWATGDRLICSGTYEAA